MSDGEKRDLTATRKSLQLWLEQAMPEASEIELAELSPPGGGSSNDTLLSHLSWREKGEHKERGICVQITPSGNPVFPSYDLERMYLIQKALGEKTDVPVPRVLWYEGDSSIVGAPFYGMEKVEGQICKDFPSYHQEGWLRNLPADKQAQAWWSAVESLAKLHRVDTSILGLDFLDKRKPGQTFLDSQLAYYEDFLAWGAEGESQPTVEAALAWIKANKPTGPEPVSICWGDTKFGNMIYQGTRCAALVDWEMVALGDPEQDFAFWLFMDDHFCSGVFGANGRIPGFPSHEETIERYEALMGRKLRNLHFYRVFTGFRFGVIMVRIANQLKKRGILPADSAYGRNNEVTRLLAASLDLPPPT